jgi:F-type H+-transporting ATPase subunit b
LLGPINGILDQRQKDIKDTYDQLDADRAAMERVRKEYEDRLAGIEQQARERIQAAVKEAQELRTSIITDAQKQAESIVQNGQSELERERIRTFVEMRKQVADLAILAAAKVVGESMDDARHRNLVDQFIASVGTEPQNGAKQFSSNGNSANGAGTAGAA